MAEPNPIKTDSQIIEDEVLSGEEIEVIIAQIDEKFLEIQKKIILSRFNEENKPAQEITKSVLSLIKMLAELAEKPELQDNYLNFAGKYTFLATFIKDFTSEEVPSFPV